MTFCDKSAAACHARLVLAEIVIFTLQAITMKLSKVQQKNKRKNPTPTQIVIAIAIATVTPIRIPTPKPTVTTTVYHTYFGRLELFLSFIQISILKSTKFLFLEKKEITFDHARSPLG